MTGIEANDCGWRGDCDPLELGISIIVAIPRLRETVRQLTPNYDEARLLVEHTLHAAWHDRAALDRETDIHEWLVRTLRAQMMN